MKKRLFYIILSICLLFSVNVKAAEKKNKIITVRFIVGCESSENAYRILMKNAISTNANGSIVTGKEYRFELPADFDLSSIPGYKNDEESGGFGDTSDSEGCAPKAVNKLACSFGCLEGAINAATNHITVDYQNATTSDLFNAFNGVGKSVGAYCMEVCVDKKKFVAPESDTITVKQGQKFTFENRFGHILTFIDDVRTCYTFFDSDSWKSAYNNDVSTINNKTSELQQQSYSACSGSRYVNGFCVKYRPNKETGKPEISSKKPATCGYGFELSGSTCRMTESYKQQLINERKNAANDIESNLIPAAEACYNHMSKPAEKCDEVYIKYDDEIYGNEVENDKEYKKLVSSGRTETRENYLERNTSLSNPTVIYNCPDSDSGCSTSSKYVNNFLKFRRMKFYSEYHWDTVEDFFSCVNINGKSYLRCSTAEAKAPNRYLTIGKNFPVSFNSSIGPHEIKIEYKCNGTNSDIYAEDADSCIYNVEGCKEGVCVPKDENGGNNNGNNGNNGGIEVIYRVVDLNDPFPNRASGDNWTGSESLITNNRGVEAESVYNLTPYYTIELDPAKIKEIRRDNKNIDYGSFENLTCTNGENCKSAYVAELVGKGYLTIDKGD